jgi:hypothetical protein
MAGELDHQEKQIVAKSQKDFAFWIEHFAIGRAVPFQRLLKPRMEQKDWPSAWHKQQVRDIHGTWMSLEDAMQLHEVSPLVLPFSNGQLPLMVWNVSQLSIPSTQSRCLNRIG